VSAPERPPSGPLCPRCGTPHDPGQEYCLECGYRLQPAGGVLGRLSAAWQDRFGWYPGDWFWRVLLGLVIAVAGATAAIVLTDAGAENQTIVATQGGGPPHTPTTAPETATVTLPSVSVTTPSWLTVNAYEVSLPGQTVPEKYSVGGPDAVLLGEVVSLPHALSPTESAAAATANRARFMDARSTS